MIELSVKVADKFQAMGDFELLDAKDVMANINGSPKRLQEAIDNGEIGGGGDSVWKGTQAEFDALDKSTLKDGQEVIITDDYDSNGDIYSTEEIVVGRWIDGKPIYRRTFVISTVTAQAYTPIAGATNIKELIKYYGFVYNTDGLFSIGRWVTTSVVGGVAKYFNYDIANPKSMTITLEYTKNAD